MLAVFLYSARITNVKAHFKCQWENKPWWIYDKKIPLLANLQGAVCVWFAQSISCINGGSCQCFIHGHLHVYTGQMHHHGLVGKEGDNGSYQEHKFMLQIPKHSPSSLHNRRSCSVQRKSCQLQNENSGISSFESISNRPLSAFEGWHPFWLQEFLL